jgi:hypothetical protein
MVLTIRSIGLALLLAAGAGSATTAGAQDDFESYRTHFDAELPMVAPRPVLKDYATAERFNALYMGAYEEKIETTLDNYAALMSWGSSYYHMALNAMYRATGDIKYFEASTRMTSATLSARDDHRGLSLFTGEIAPVWGCGKYDKRGRVGHLVHSGMITYPMLDMLCLAQENPDCARVLGDRAKPWLEDILKSVDYFDPHWTDGPAEGEGYYISRNEETSTEGKVQSANRISAQGRALWLAGKLTGEARYRHKALAIGHYLKNRIYTDTDNDASLWIYTPLPEERAQSLPRAELNKIAQHGEDISHGALTAGFPIMLARDGEVFDQDDMQRLARTVTKVMAQAGEGILLPFIGGNPKDKPHKSGMRMTTRWLELTPYDGEVYTVIWAFLRDRIEPPEPLDIAMLLQYAPAGPAK